MLLDRFLPAALGFFLTFLPTLTRFWQDERIHFLPVNYNQIWVFSGIIKRFWKLTSNWKTLFFTVFLEWRSNSKSNWTYLYTTDAPPPATMVQIRPFLLRTVSFNEAPLFASRSATKASFLMKKERKVKTYKCSYHLKPYSSYMYQKINWQKKNIFLKKNFRWNTSHDIWVTTQSFPHGVKGWEIFLGGGRFFYRVVRI